MKKMSYLCKTILKKLKELFRIKMLKNNKGLDK